MALLRRLSFIMFFFGLLGCGGGDGGLDGGNDPAAGDTPDPIVISLVLSDELVSDQSPATITATVMQGTTPITSNVVTFETTLGSFTPGASTALTDSAGVATIVLNAGNIEGAGTITATLDTGEVATIGFTSQGDELVDDGISVLVVSPSFVKSRPELTAQVNDGLSSPGAMKKNTAGKQLSPTDAAIAILTATANRQPSLYLGRVANIARWLYALLPNAYMKIMTKQAKEEFM